MGKTSMELISNPPTLCGMKKLIASALLSPEMMPDRVGERISALREALKLNKADFADSISLDRSTLTKIEAGTKGLDIAMGVRIGELYGVGLDYIYRGQAADLPMQIRVATLNALQEIRLDKAARANAN
jgi:transcriptional regulator with XRE-family HTH domain